MILWKTFKPFVDAFTFRVHAPNVRLGPESRLYVEAQIGTDGPYWILEPDRETPQRLRALADDIEAAQVELDALLAVGEEVQS